MQGETRERLAPTGFETDLAVLRALDEHGWTTVADLAEVVAVDPVRVDQVCYRLQREGSVRFRGDGEFALTAGGAERLRNHRLRAGTR